MRRFPFALILCVMVALVGLFMSTCTKSDRVPTLIWWNIGSPQPGFRDDMRILSDYIEERIGVRLDIRQAGWGDSGQRFTAMINSGEYFDILFVGGSDYNRFVALGAFADITDMLPVEAPQLWEYIPDVLWDGVRVRDRIFSVPTYKDSSITGYYYWDDYFVQKYDIDLTQTSRTFLDETFRRLKAGEQNPRYYPYVITRNHTSFIFDSYDELSSQVTPMGVRHDDPERRVVITLEQPDIVQAFRYMHGWYRDGIINPDANLIDEAPIGKTFFMAQAWPSVAIPYAVGEGVDKLHPVRFFGPLYSTASIQGSMNAISTNSRHKKEALQFLQLVNSDTRLRDMLHYGIEGKHYVYVNEGTAIRLLRTDWPLINYQQGSYFIQTPREDVPPGYWDEVRQQNEEAVPSVMLGFMMDIEPVMSEIVNCRLVWDKYSADLLTGASNPDIILPLAVAELKANGLDVIMAEAQRQIDELYGR